MDAASARILVQHCPPPSGRRVGGVRQRRTLWYLGPRTLRSQSSPLRIRACSCAERPSHEAARDKG
jgi:hypothetical protein